MSLQLSELIMGRADIRMDNVYTNHLSFDTAQLSSSYSIGQCENCTVQEKRTYKDKRHVGVMQTVDKLVVNSQVIFNISTLKGSTPNLHMLHGGSGVDADFFVGTNNKTYFRVEIVFLYPDRSSTMTWVIPKAIITDPSKINLVSMKDPSQIEFSLETLYPNHSTWGNSSAKVLFSS